MKRLFVIFLVITISFNLNVSFVSASATEYKLTPTDGADNDNFGMSVAVSGDTVIIGAPDDDDKGDDSGSAYVFVRSGESWFQQAKLTAGDGTKDAGFGCSVAIDGDTAVIGAARDLENNNTSGSAYVFVRSGESWSQQAKLIASDNMTGDMFGWSVDIDGGTVVVGAYGNTGFKGSAYVFLSDGSSWTQQARIDAGDDAMPGDSFGYSVSLSGNSIIIGVPYDDDDIFSNPGSAYVFVSNGSNWTEQAKLIPSDPTVNDKFGYSVSIGGDISAIGAYGDDGHEGSAYVFVRDSGVWTQQEKLEPADNAAEDYVGWSVAVSEDSTLVAAPFSNDLSGLAYLFVRDGNSWTQQTSLLPSDSEPYILFGLSVAVSNNVAVIGAPHDNVNDILSGSAYIFDLAVNVPPVADAGGPYTVDEGEEITLDASASYDLDDSIIRYEWDLDNDGEYDNADGITAVAPFNDDGVYSVGLRVTDSYEAFSTNSTTVTVVNVPPAVNAGPDIILNLGEVVFIDAVFTDPGTADTHSYMIDWGDDTTETGLLTEPGTVTGNHIYNCLGIYEVAVEVIDDDGGLGRDTFMVHVLPVAAELIKTLNDEIKALQLPDGKGKSKEVSLDTTIKILSDSNPKNDKAAINTLEALINKLESQRGKQIPVDDADDLIAIAREIITALGGGA